MAHWSEPSPQGVGESQQAQDDPIVGRDRPLPCVHCETFIRSRANISDGSPRTVTSKCIEMEEIMAEQSSRNRLVELFTIKRNLRAVRSSSIVMFAQQVRDHELRSGSKTRQEEQLSGPFLDLLTNAESRLSSSVASTPSPTVRPLSSTVRLSIRNSRRREAVEPLRFPVPPEPLTRGTH